MGKWNLLLLCFSLTCIIKGQSLAHTKWVLVSTEDLETGKSKQLGTKMHATLNFDTDSTYSGTFCNQYKGHYKTGKDNKLRMATPEATKMACLGISIREKELFGMYVQAAKFRTDKNFLFIFTLDKRRITFSKE